LAEISVQFVTKSAAVEYAVQCRDDVVRYKNSAANFTQILAPPLPPFQPHSYGETETTRLLVRIPYWYLLINLLTYLLLGAESFLRS